MAYIPNLNMKRLTLVLLLSLAAANGLAQQIEISCRETNGLDKSKASGARFLTRHNGLDIVATNKNYSLNNDIGFGVVLYGLDSDGKAAKTLIVSKQKKSLLVAANAVGDTAYFIVYGFDKKAPMDMHVIKANLTDWTLCGEPTAVYQRKNKASDYIDWEVATSPDGHATAIAIKEFSESPRIAKAFGNKDTEHDALLVTDNRFATLWRRDDLPGWYNTLCIDNDETVHAMLVGNSDNTTYFLFANHSSISDETFIDSLNRSDIYSCRMLNYIDGCFVAGGTIGEKRRGLQNVQYSAIYALAYDTRTKRFRFNPQPLTSTEFAVLENVDIDLRRSNVSEMQGLTNHDGIATPFGGVMQLWSFMTTIAYSKGGSFYVYALNGSLMAAIDTSANFVWRVPIRTNIHSTNDKTPIHQHLTYSNGRTCVVQTENSKAPDNYNIDNHLPKLALMTGADATLAVYTITDDGKVSKYTSPLNSLLFLNGRLQKLGNDWFVTLSKTKKVRIAHLKGM